MGTFTAGVNDAQRDYAANSLQNTFVARYFREVIQLLILFGFEDSKKGYEY